MESYSEMVLSVCEFTAQSVHWAVLSLCVCVGVRAGCVHGDVGGAYNDSSSLLLLCACSSLLSALDVMDSLRGANGWCSKYSTMNLHNLMGSAYQNVYMFIIVVVVHHTLFNILGVVWYCTTEVSNLFVMDRFFGAVRSLRGLLWLVQIWARNIKWSQMICFSGPH